MGLRSPPVNPRTSQFKVLLSDLELGWLRALAEQGGVTASDWVRLRIRTEAWAARLARCGHTLGGAIQATKRCALEAGHAGKHKMRAAVPK